MLPRIGDFFERYSEMELEIGMGDRLVDLVREGIDCVLRAGEPRDSSMVGRRVALLEQVTCASQSYLAQHGEPKTQPPPMPVSVMYPHHRHLSQRVRVFVDWVADQMRRAR